jgi:hypothetical protein
MGSKDCSLTDHWINKLIIEVMRRIMLMALGTVAVIRAAKYFGIESFEDLVKFVKPKVKHLMHA